MHLRWNSSSKYEEVKFLLHTSKEQEMESGVDKSLNLETLLIDAANFLCCNPGVLFAYKHEKKQWILFGMEFNLSSESPITFPLSFSMVYVERLLKGIQELEEVGKRSRWTFSAVVAFHKQFVSRWSEQQRGEKQFTGITMSVAEAETNWKSVLDDDGILVQIRSWQTNLTKESQQQQQGTQ